AIFVVTPGPTLRRGGAGASPWAGTCLSASPRLEAGHYWELPTSTKQRLTSRSTAVPVLRAHRGPSEYGSTGGRTPAMDLNSHPMTLHLLGLSAAPTVGGLRKTNLVHPKAANMRSVTSSSGGCLTEIRVT